MFATLAQRVATGLDVALTRNGHASMVVSGGGTPAPLFRLLSTKELPWRQVTITLADERWVPVNDAASNERMVRELLLTGRARDARFVGLKTPHATPEEGQSACNAALAAIARPFQVVLLGFGEDGHFASLFPGTPNLDQGLDAATRQHCLPVRAPAAAQPRMSLTLTTLLDCRDLILLSTGPAKQAVWQRAKQPGPATELPVRALLSGKNPTPAHFWAP